MWHNWISKIAIVTDFLRTLPTRLLIVVAAVIAVLFALSLWLVMSGEEEFPGALKKADQEIYGEAFALAKSGKFDQAFSLAEDADDQNLSKVLLWYSFQREDRKQNQQTIASFYAENSHWPRSITGGGSAVKNRPHIYSADPNQPPKISTALKELKNNRKKGFEADTRLKARDLWSNSRFASSPRDERRFLAAFSKLLDENSHLARASDFYWRGIYDRGDGLRPRLSNASKKFLNVWRDYKNKQRSLVSAKKEVGAKFSDHPVFLIPTILEQDRVGDAESARTNFAKLDPKKIPPSQLWRTRHILARQALRDDLVKTAYEIASEHELAPSKDFYEAEWLSGWIALSKMKNPEIAAQHFRRALREAGPGWESARAYYWLGRVREGTGELKSAHANYNECAKDALTFYGQLCLERTEKPFSSVNLDVTRTEPQNLGEIENNELYLISRQLLQIKQERLAQPFLKRVAEISQNYDTFLAAGKKVQELGYGRMSILLGKSLSWPNGPALPLLYPTLPFELPDTAKQHPALVHAIVRQESSFNETAVSPKDARGLMQLLPETAKRMAKKESVPYEEDKLTSDPSFNVRLGGRYLRDSLEVYNNSLLLVLSAYNAGHGRAKSWRKTFGNPNDPHKDVLDWAESIPFRETRLYVQKVIASYGIYKALLEGKDQVPQPTSAMIGNF